MTRTDTYIAFMMDHAAGNHPQSFAIAADLHVALAAKGAETARLWSTIGGVLLETSLSVPDSAGRTRSRAYWRRQNDVSATNILEQAPDSLAWRRGLSGVRYASAGAPGTKFMKLDAGQSAPMHGHHGLEATVVLSGCFSDGHGTYTRGDLVLGEPGLRHKPAAVGADSCICFVAHRPNPFWSYFQ